MNFFIVTEPNLSENYWNSKYVSGMRGAVREYKGKLIELDLNSISKISEKTPVIINGRNPEWISVNTKRLLDNGYHPILLATNNDTGLSNVSSLTFDFYGIYSSWCAHFYSLGYKNMALLGVRPDNTSDNYKLKAFCDFNERFNENITNNVYKVTTSLKDSCENFIKHINRFDVVLCTNDLVAIILLSLLRKTSNEKKLLVHSFWDSPLAKFLNTEFKTYSLDYHELGRQSIKLYTFLSNNKSVQSISATISGVPILNTELKPPQIAKTNKSFMQEESAKAVYNLEKLFSLVDDIDLSILKGMLSKITYEQIAEQQNVSVNTVKYRVKKMLNVIGSNSRKELLLYMTTYLGKDYFIDK